MRQFEGQWTLDLVATVAGIGQRRSADLDKFDTFGLTAGQADDVGAPLIEDSTPVSSAGRRTTPWSSLQFLRRRMVKARAAARPDHPKTLHYKGDGLFMVAGDILKRRALFTKVR